MKTYYRLIVFFIIVGAIFNNVMAQNNNFKTDDVGRIVLHSYISPKLDGLSSSTKKMLTNKLNQIATKNGMGGNSPYPRFIITPNITVLTKDLTATAPPMTALTLEITFYIGDGVDGTLFASTSIETKGVGTNETKAYISALKQIKSSNPELKNLVSEGKRKILEYYNDKCDFIIKEAQTLESQSEYESAILVLTTVPDVCKDCYNKCMDAVVPIYQNYIDKECEIRLSEAKKMWNSGQDIEAATKANIILADIDPYSNCFGKSEAFSKSIAARIHQLDQRQWDLKLKKQQDEIDIKHAEIQVERKRQQDEVDLEYASIQAAKGVSVAFANKKSSNNFFDIDEWF